jgi:hypothetical protein
MLTNPGLGTRSRSSTRAQDFETSTSRLSRRPPATPAFSTRAAFLSHYPRHHVRHESGLQYARPERAGTKPPGRSTPDCPESRKN